MPLRLDIGELTFRELVRAADAAVIANLSRRHVSYQSIVRATEEIDAEANDLLSAMFVSDSPHRPSLGEIDVVPTVHHNGTAAAPITLFAREVEQGWAVALEHDIEHLSSADANALLMNYEELVRRFIAEPDRPITELSLPGAADDIGQPIRDGLVSLPEQIIAAAREHRDAVAVRCGAESLTYSELIDQAMTIAGRLNDLGVGVGDRVALLVARSVDAVASLLGVLFAGAAYVPIDLEHPMKRRDSLLAEARVQALITTDSAVDVRRHDHVVLPLPMPAGQTSSRSETWSAVDLDQPAYVIFTSGSTGQPRGVEITHRQLASSTQARFDFYEHGPERYLMVSSSGFDSSVAGYFWTLAAGGELILPTEDEAHDVDRLAALISATQASHTLMVPSLYRGLLSRDPGALQSLRTVIVAGEACTPGIVTRHFDEHPSATLINEYGPTEATVWSSAHTCMPNDDPVPIGHAIPGAVLRVADQHLRPKPLGVAGQLLIAGAGVAHGYINDDAATAERFVEDDDGVRWYKSGDRVRRRADGSLDFLGRLDDQLSLGGVRVEPEELAAVLRSADDVRAAAVVLDGSSGRQRLVAFVEADDVTAMALAEHCRERLPAALVPSRYQVMASLPRTTRGKLDRRALSKLAQQDPANDRPVTSGADGEPLSAQLVAIVQLWRQGLQTTELDADTDFFAAGGDSLGAVELAQLLEDKLGSRVPIEAITRNRTPRRFAEWFDLDLDASIRSMFGSGTLEEVLNAGDGRAPVVLLPGSMGRPVAFAHLVRSLDPDQAAVGFRLPGVDLEEPLLHTVPEQAERLLDEILAVDDRPLRLLGLSTGGLLALELAQQMTLRGRPPEVVVMVDTIYPGLQHLGRPTLATLARQLTGGSERRFAATQLRSRTEAFLRRERDRAKLVFYDRTNRDLTANLHKRQLNMLAHRSERMYKPVPYDGPVLFFAASTTLIAKTIEPWSGLLSNMDVIKITGVHQRILQNADLVKPLGRALQAYLDSGAVVQPAE